MLNIPLFDVVPIERTRKLRHHAKNYNMRRTERETRYAQSQLLRQGEDGQNPIRKVGSKSNDKQEISDRSARTLEIIYDTIKTIGIYSHNRLTLAGAAENEILFKTAREKVPQVVSSPGPPRKTITNQVADKQ